MIPTYPIKKPTQSRILDKSHVDVADAVWRGVLKVLQERWVHRVWRRPWGDVWDEINQ